MVIFIEININRKINQILFFIILIILNHVFIKILINKFFLLKILFFLFSHLLTNLFFNSEKIKIL